MSYMTGCFHTTVYDTTLDRYEVPEVDVYTLISFLVRMYMYVYTSSDPLLTECCRISLWLVGVCFTSSESTKNGNIYIYIYIYIYNYRQ